MQVFMASSAWFCSKSLKALCPFELMNINIYLLGPGFIQQRILSLTVFSKDILWKNIVVLQGTNPKICHGYINPSFSQLSSNQTHIKKNALKYIQRRSTLALINHIVEIAFGFIEHQRKHIWQLSNHFNDWRCQIR